jgi:hypothetical protein
MLTNVRSLEKLGGFRLRVTFSDGSGGIHDFIAPEWLRREMEAAGELTRTAAE